MYRKLQQFPHMFEVANASGRLDSYDLAGNYRHTTASALTHVRFQIRRHLWTGFGELYPGGVPSPSSLIQDLYLRFVGPGSQL